MILKTTKIYELPLLKEKNNYMFKSKVIINTFNHKEGNNELTEDMEILKK